jgi:glutathione peroxidase
MKIILMAALYVIVIQSFAQNQAISFYDLNATTIEGKLYSFSQLKGKRVLIVNIATRCSLAPQMKKLEELYQQAKGKNFEIIAFPSNDFGNNEPGTNEQIKQVCQTKYGISFPLMEKAGVKNNKHQVYDWLTQKKYNGLKDFKIIWNYQKFLIDENGKIVESYLPVVSPTSEKIMNFGLNH